MQYMYSSTTVAVLVMLYDGSLGGVIGMWLFFGQGDCWLAKEPEGPGAVGSGYTRERTRTQHVSNPAQFRVSFSQKHLHNVR